MFLLMSGTNNFAKKYFLTPFWDSTKFSLFCKVRACSISPSKIQFSKKCLKCCTKCFFWWVEQKILPKNYFLTPFWDSTKFSLFCKGPRLSIFCQKFNFPKTALNVVVTFLLMSGTNNFAKNIFLPHFEIVQNFHYFLRSAPVNFLSKIQFSKKCLKYCRNVSFDELNKLFCQIILP